MNVKDIKSKKVLWFSRHLMSDAQVSDLVSLFGVIELHGINKTISSAREIADEIEAADIVAVVMPLPLQMEVLKLAKDKPVLICRNHRVQKEDGTFEFHHAGWTKLLKVEILSEEISNIPAPDGAFRS